MEVRAEKVTKTFFRKREGTNIFTAVEPCDITLSPGRLTVIGGRSGSGKSTLINMLSGILRPDSGKVLYEGRDIYEMSDEELSRFRGENIGYIPQGRSVIPTLTVLENVEMPMFLTGAVDTDKALDLMEQFSIAHLADAMPRSLSGGELRRMAIARSLVRSPKVLFADEPTSDLDDENTQIVFGFLRDIARGGTAVLAVTHEEDAYRYADLVLRMEAGKLDTTGPAL